jgi:Acetyltransferase (GNAT) domain
MHSSHQSQIYDRSETGVAFQVFESIKDLPEGSESLFEAANNFSLSAQWFCNMVENGLASDSKALFGVLSDSNSVLGIIPLSCSRNFSLGSLTNCYSCIYMPLIATCAPIHQTSWLLGRAFGKYCSRQAVTYLDCLPSDWPALESFSAGVESVGFCVRRFRQFGNWYEPIKGRSWDQYLASRPSQLRELLRRRGRRLVDNGLSFESIWAEEDLSAGIASYETVYRRSWKPAEPFPHFNPQLMRYAARLGMLRLGLCWRGEKPVAAQLWIVAHGIATVMKLAHDQAEKPLSPGTLLTAHMIRQLIKEGIGEIDFGRGDDPYKRLWARYSRERIGLFVANPRRVHGLTTLIVHNLGRATLRLRRSNRSQNFGAALGSLTSRMDQVRACDAVFSHQH